VHQKRMRPIAAPAGLEVEPHPQLDRAGSPGANGKVVGGLVRSDAVATIERAGRRDGKPCVRSDCDRKDRAVQDVEEIGPELETHVLSELPVLGHG